MTILIKQNYTWYQLITKNTVYLEYKIIEFLFAQP